ncbi:hypothetical protein PG985_013938 [Apiospora marii]|uniref:Uncharacterized protein n=1 Tax=Apiospora marii TaxID=335849 RepID=A0ABR1R6K7_9PEZI
MAGFNKKKNNKKGAKGQKKNGNKKDEIKDDVPVSAATNTTTLADAPAPAAEQHKQRQYLTAAEFAADREELTQELQKILNSLAEQKAWPDSVLAALHSPELHELFAQHVALLRDEAKVFEGMEECGDGGDASYLNAVLLTSLAERALMEHAALKRRVRRYNYVHPPPPPPPKEGEQHGEGRELSEEATAFLSKHRSTQAELQVQLAAKLESAQLNLDATKRHVSGYRAQKELEKAQSK